MENATDAMKMAFAVLVFITALSLAVFSFSRVRQTSAKIAQDADEKEYYDRLTLAESEISSLASANRVVGVETVIPTLYRYYKENYTVIFYRGTGFNPANGSFSNIEPMVLYYTETPNNYLSKSSLLVSSSGGGRGVFGFDKQDEQARNEPWNATQESDYDFIKAFINGISTNRYYTSRVISPYDGRNYLRDAQNGPYYTINFNDYTFKGLVGKNYQFVERYGEYNYNNVLTNADDENSGITSDVTGSVDILENGEIVNKNNGTTKRVIQYIYIIN